MANQQELIDTNSEDNRKKIPQKLIPPLIPKNSMNTNLDKLKILINNYL